MYSCKFVSASDWNKIMTQFKVQIEADKKHKRLEKLKKIKETYPWNGQAK